MQRRGVIAVVGTGRQIEPYVSNARELGRMIAENGWILVSGGRNAGVMKAANEGAKQINGGLTIGVLPDRAAAVSPDVDVAIITEMGEARNNIIVLTADVIISSGVDDAGTASEIALAIKNGKPVILVEAKDEGAQFFKDIGDGQVHCAAEPGAAIEIARRLLDI